MGKKEDLTGQRFGRWTVVEEAFSKYNKAHWKVICDCGNEGFVATSTLRSGQSKSCGCIREEYYKNCGKHHMSKTKPYNAWAHMIERCRNQNARDYKYYGGRGITVCEKWNDFIGFWEDMKDGYQDGLRIERVDNEKGYCLENCIWADRIVQNNNTRQNRYVDFMGKRFTVAQLCKIYGIHPSSLQWRLNNWEDIEKCLFTDIQFQDRSKKEVNNVN